MFTVFWSYFGYKAEPTFKSLDEAIAYAKSKGFTAWIYDNGEYVGEVCPIGGWRKSYV